MNDRKQDSRRHNCTIVNLDEPGKRIEALYNPSKIKITKSVPWNRHGNAGSDAEMLEFTCAKNRTLSLELFFDGHELGVDVDRTWIEPLLGLTLAGKRAAKKGNTLTRPPFVIVTWGRFAPFKGVIESIEVEYSMFRRDGTAVRATATVSITEVSLVQMTEDHRSRARSLALPE